MLTSLLLPWTQAPIACASCSSATQFTCRCVLCVQIRDDYGKEVGSEMCHIVGADGGIVPRPISLPSYGLMTDVAYRW